MLGVGAIPSVFLRFGRSAFLQWMPCPKEPYSKTHWRELKNKKSNFQDQVAPVQKGFRDITSTPEQSVSTSSLNLEPWALIYRLHGRKWHLKKFSSISLETQWLSDTHPKATFSHPPFSLLCDWSVFGARGGKIKVNIFLHKKIWKVRAVCGCWNIWLYRGQWQDMRQDKQIRDGSWQSRESGFSLDNRRPKKSF